MVSGELSYECLSDESFYSKGSFVLIDFLLVIAYCNTHHLLSTIITTFQHS